MAAQALMKRGKRAMATYVKDECLRPSGTPQLTELLTYLLDPDKPLDDTDRIDWCRCLVASGETFNDFAKNVKQYDNAVMCGLVWTADFVAYRCRTCGISPSMSLCSNCFLAGDHTGHDYNMFRSQAGGACDCGDVNVMKQDGFCSRHGPHQKGKQGAPGELLAVAEVMMPRLVWRLIQYLRDNCPLDVVGTHLGSTTEAEEYINFLHQLSDLGAAMRAVFTTAMTDSQSYTKYTQVVDPGLTYQVYSQKQYESALQTLHAPPPPDDFPEICELQSALVHHTMLEELLFWVVKYEFPQKLVTLLLELLPNDTYKTAFTTAFVQHYSRISCALANSHLRNRISNRVVHISIQLLSPENLAREMVEKRHLLHIMLACLRHMVEGVLTTGGLHECRHSTQLVVDCTRDVLKEHCYWPIVSDLINILAHKSIAVAFLSDPKLLVFWFEMIAYFQGMNMNQRELDQHVDYEPETYYAAFSAELEICASTMWSMVQHCTSQEQNKLVKNVIGVVLRVLQDWFEGVGVRPFSKPNALQVTFHLPLHRHLAVFLSGGVRHQGMPLTELLPSPDFLQMVMIHLLQIQVAYHEIFAGMWVRNGLQIKGQAMTYVQCHFCNSMVDADLYLLQVCAASLDPDYFLRQVLERFHVLDLLTFAPHDAGKKLGFLETDKQMPMLEGALTFLSILLGVRTQLGMSEDRIRRLEMVTLLCTSDLTHSKITDCLPEKCGQSGHQVQDFEDTLQDIADYKAPVFEAGGSMQQGSYAPKTSVWEQEFNPVYLLMRVMYKKDFQNAMDRFTEYARHSAGYQGSESPWPPFCLPEDSDMLPEYNNLCKLLHCRTMHAVMYTLLYKALNDTSVSDAVLYFTVHLLELALHIPNPNAQAKKKIAISESRTDKSFSNWFPVDDIHANLRTVIPQVVVTTQTMSPVLTPRVGSGSDHNPDDDDFFQLAPSVLSAPHRGGSGMMGVIPDGTSSEVINAVQALLENTANQVDEADTPSPPPGPSGNQATRGVRSMGVSTNMETKWRNRHINVNESMLSLLMKLHSKLSTPGAVASKTCTYVPQTERTTKDQHCYEGCVGDGTFFIGRVLDLACRKCEENRKYVHQLYTDSHPTDGATQAGAKKKKVAELDERRRKARVRQKKVMADFANKQKSFMEKMKDEQMGEDLEPDSAESAVNERMYDCVICNQETSSTDDRPMCLVALLQCTSVLGHRRCDASAPVLPTSDDTQQQPAPDCAAVYDKRLRTLLNHFDESSVLMSLNIGWQGGVHTQTCGHYVHLDCHKSYVDTLTQQATLNTAKGEFTCPLCRQLCNSAMPLLPDWGASLSPTLPTDTGAMVRHIADCMVNRPITPGSSTLTNAMSSVFEHLTHATPSDYRTISNAKSNENVIIFVCSVLRCNLEVETLQRGGSPCLPRAPLAAKKSCLLPLLHVLSMHSKLLMSQTYREMWYHIAGGEDSTSKSVVPQHKEVPVLLKDATALLIQFVLTMPPTMEKEVFTHLVQALYNVVYIQALVKVSLKFSEEERSAWRAKVIRGQSDERPQTMEWLLGHVISQLYDSGLYDDDAMNDPHVPAICCVVWSPQSVESEVQSTCLSYLSNAALLQHHMYGDDLPQLTHRDESEELKLLCTYLDLTPHVTSSQSQDTCHLVLSSASCVRWLTGAGPSVTLPGWCLHLRQFIRGHVLEARNVLSLPPVWETPRLFSLPRQYDRIFQYYRRRPCPTCNSLPKDPAICLMCGRILCFKEKCCEQLKKSECVQHSVTCGGGLGIFLIVLSSFIVVIRGPRATIWGSVYLDQHGEEDRELKRGKPLFLCEERYKLLEQQWLTHSFDRACKRWITHRDQL